MKELKEAFEELMNMSERERLNYYDTGFFNNVTLAYMKRAMEDANIPAEQISDALFNAKLLHDEMSAMAILEYYNKNNS